MAYYRLIITVILQSLSPRPGRTLIYLSLLTRESVITPHNPPRCVPIPNPDQRNLPAAGRLRPTFALLHSIDYNSYVGRQAVEVS